MSLSRRAFSTNVASLAGRSLMAIDELTVDELRGLLSQAHALKAAHRSPDAATRRAAALAAPLAGDSVAMIFQKRSTRTRVSTETGTSLLGGHALFLGPADVQLGVNETMRDTANVLSGFNSLILARVFGHDDIVELKKHASVPVINALSHLHHPLQTLADLMALQEQWGEANLAGKTVAWVGDGNNVLHDLMLGAAMMSMHVRVATPTGYEADPGIVARTEALAKASGATVHFTNDAMEAATGSDVVVTDTWVSMGEEDVYDAKMADFAGYQVDADMMDAANDGALFMHCLPRHQEEVHDEVFYSDSSIVFPEAENRMWTVMALMKSMLGR